MTTTNEQQAQDSAQAKADAEARTVNRSELDEAIGRRQAALERARAAEEKLAKIEAAEADRARAEKEAQGKFQELAKEAEAKAADLKSRMEASQALFEKLQGRHRLAVDQRFNALPEAVRKHLDGRLGDKADLDAYEDAVALAEAMQSQTSNTNGGQPRNIAGQPSAGRVGTANAGNGKASAEQIAKMTRAEQSEYLKKFYR